MSDTGEGPPEPLELEPEPERALLPAEPKPEPEPEPEPLELEPEPERVREADVLAAGERARRHLRGTIIVFVGVLWLTPDSVLIKLAEREVAQDLRLSGSSSGDGARQGSGGWDTLFWRQLIYGVTMTCGLLLHASRMRSPAGGGCVGALAARVRATGRLGLWAFLSYLPANISFVIAQSHTTAANVLVIVATAPLFAALFGRCFLAEPVPLRTTAAIAASIAAVAALFWSELSVDLSADELVGLIFALTCAVGLAAYVSPTTLPQQSHHA
eukprot:COSAG04_NODE_889_length_9610_cov_13.087898_2_plen_271_part_00